MQAIICGDVLRILGTLKSGTVDICCTDPPYNVGISYNPRNKNTHKHQCRNEDNLPEEKYWAWFKKVFAEVYRVMGPGYLYVSHSHAGIYQAKPILENIGFRYIQGIIWTAKNLPPFRKCNRLWMLLHEQILFMTKGTPVPLITNQKGLHFTSIINAARPQTNYKEKRMHPAQKPIKLYKTLLQRTPGRLVLDPFSCRGTTAQTCRYLKKDYIVIDRVPEYCKMAHQDIPWKK